MFCKVIVVSMNVFFVSFGGNWVDVFVDVVVVFNVIVFIEDFGMELGLKGMMMICFIDCNLYLYM